jgi:hypothetical protein
MSFKWSDWHNNNDKNRGGWDRRGDERDRGNRRAGR